MAVTKATYTATGTWTASQLATIFESAFVASGLMSAWHDSFLSGSIENRILAVTYDGGATYGTTYYWFMFDTTGMSVSVCAAWDGAGNVPSGTQYLDYFSTATNTAGNHWRPASLSTTSDVSVIRYTSAIDTTQSWYTVVQGSTSYTFTIPPASFTVAPWVDMDKTMFHHFLQCSASCPSSERAGLVAFASRGGVRRSYAMGAAKVGDINARANMSHTVMALGAIGRASNDIVSNQEYLGFCTYTGIDVGMGIIVPMGNSAANPAYSTNFSPVFTGFPISLYISTPNNAADLGVSFHYANNTMVRGDKLIVTASVEEWEILNVANNVVVTAGASPMFLARVV